MKKTSKIKFVFDYPDNTPDELEVYLSSEDMDESDVFTLGPNLPREREVAVGEYVLGCNVSGELARIKVKENESVECKIEIPAFVKVQGRVYDADGKLLNGAYVYYDIGKRPYRCVVTENGNYELCVPTKRGDLCVFAKNHVMRRVGEVLPVCYEASGVPRYFPTPEAISVDIFLKRGETLRAKIISPAGVVRPEFIVSLDGDMNISPPVITDNVAEFKECVIPGPVLIGVSENWDDKYYRFHRVSLYCERGGDNEFRIELPPYDTLPARANTPGSEVVDITEIYRDE